MSLLGAWVAAKRSTGHIHSRTVVLVIVAGWAFLAVTYLRSPSVHASLADRNSENTLILFDPHKDAPQGSVVDLPAKDLLGRPVMPAPLGLRNRVLVFIAGGCQTCTEGKLARIRHLIGDSSRVVLIFEAPATEARREAVRWPANYRIVADSDSKLSRALNATFMQPRGFCVDKGLRIEAEQEFGEDLGHFVERANA